MREKRIKSFKNFLFFSFAYAAKIIIIIFILVGQVEKKKKIEKTKALIHYTFIGIIDEAIICFCFSAAQLVNQKSSEKIYFYTYK